MPDQKEYPAPEVASAETSVPNPDAHALARTKPAPEHAAPTAEKKPVEEWSRLKKTEAHWLGAARGRGGWAIGRELTEKEYDAAIDVVQKVRMR